MDVVSNGSHIAVDLDLASRKNGVDGGGEETLAGPRTLLDAVGFGRPHHPPPADHGCDETSGRNGRWSAW